MLLSKPSCDPAATAEIDSGESSIEPEVGAADHDATNDPIQSGACSQAEPYNFQKELQALRNDFPEAKGLYGPWTSPGEYTMKLEQFIPYINNHCRQLVSSFNLTLTLCGREMEAVMSQ